MGRACTVCLSPDRDAIDVALLERQPDARLARKYGVSRFAVQRHSRAHIAPALAIAAEEREALRSDDLLTRLEDINRQTLGILAAALEEKKPSVALKAIQRVESQLELQARLLGQLRDTKLNVNFQFSPEAAERVARTFLTRTPVIEATAEAADCEA
jgi:hypothetical protein